MTRRIDSYFDSPTDEWSRWMQLRFAAALLGTTEASLRGRFGRHLRSIRAEGDVELVMDGLRAKHFGKRWHVQIHRRWRSPPPAAAWRR